MLVIVSFVFLLAAACQPLDPQVIPVTRLVEEQTAAVATGAGTEVVVTRLVQVTPTPAPATRCAPTDIAAVDAVPIGAAIPLSPPGDARAGQAILWALNVAVADINEQGGILGKPVTLVVRDSQGTAARGTAVMTQLITQECVVGVVGEFHGGPGTTMKAVAEQWQTPAILAENWSELADETPYEAVFRIGPPAPLIAETKANYLEALGVDYVALVAADDVSAQAAQSLLADRGIASDRFLVDPAAADYNEAIAAIAAGRAFTDTEGIVTNQLPEAVVVQVAGEDGLRFTQQMAAAGVAPSAGTVCIAPDSAAEDTRFWEIAPDANHCVFRHVGLVPTLVNSTTQTFIADYTTLFAGFPESYALEAYDGLRLLADAINRAGSLSSEDIVDVLEASNVQLAQGTYFFDYGIENPLPAGQPDVSSRQCACTSSSSRRSVTVK